MPTSTHPWIATLAATLAISAACGSAEDYDATLDIVGPVATRAAVAWYDETHDELLFARPEEQRLSLLRVPLGDEHTRVLWQRTTVDDASLLVMLGPASSKEEAVGEELWRFSADGEDDPVRLDVLAPFSSIEQSPDGHLAVLYFGPGGSSEALHNANQVALVDLTTNVVRNLTLNGFGGELQSVHFPGATAASPGTVAVGGRTRDIVAFLAAQEIVLVDAADQTADQVGVTFRDAAFSPVASLLRAGNEMFEEPVLFLRGDASTDVAMLTLVDKPDEASGAPGFTAQVSLVPVGGGASDFTTYDGEAAPYLVTVSASAPEVVFTDIRTQQGFSVPIDTPADRILLRDLATDIGPVEQVVAWAAGGVAVHTLRLDGIEQAIGRSPERLDIQTGISELVMLDNDRALVGSGSVLYVVDFVANQVTPLRSQVAYDPDSATLDGMQLVLGTPGQPWVSTVDLTTLNPESMVLDHNITSFHVLTDVSRVMVTHDDPAGHVTVADAREPSRATSYSVWGLLLDGALDR